MPNVPAKDGGITTEIKKDFFSGIKNGAIDRTI